MISIKLIPLIIMIIISFLFATACFAYAYNEHDYFNYINTNNSTISLLDNIY